MKSREERYLDFIKKAKEVHIGYNLDFSKVEYVNNRTKVCIIDPEYGEFMITPSNLLKGKGHPKRKGKKISESKRSKTDEIIRRFEKVHQGEGLDYSKVIYVNMHTKVCIIDPEYGEYWQEPNAHLKGCGHPNKKKERKHLTNDEFIERARKIHGDRYDYSLVEYVNYRTPVKIICNKHGVFEQSPENHIYGKGCPKCGNHYSKYEDDIVSIITDRVELHNHKILDGKELDIYVPDKKVAIEFNGLKWHTEWFAGKDKNYHLSKTKMCEEKGIRLIQIFEDEYKYHKEIVISKIKHILEYDKQLPKVYGRKCIVREIYMYEAKEFLNKNHIQGFARSSVYLGCFNSDEMIGVMSFKNEGDDYWELTRFATDIGKQCIGVGGKLYKYFLRKYKPLVVKSFADRRWSTTLYDNLYIKLGFAVDNVLYPEYRYVNKEKPTERIHKFRFRKQILNRKYGFPMTMTESEMAKELGYDRIWDCGLIRYVWTAENSEAENN